MAIAIDVLKYRAIEGYAHLAKYVLLNPVCSTKIKTFSNIRTVRFAKLVGEGLYFVFNVYDLLAQITRTEVYLLLFLSVQKATNKAPPPMLL